MAVVWEVGEVIIWQATQIIDRVNIRPGYCVTSWDSYSENNERVTIVSDRGVEYHATVMGYGIDFKVVKGNHLRVTSTAALKLVTDDSDDWDSFDQKQGHIYVYQKHGSACQYEG